MKKMNKTQPTRKKVELAGRVVTKEGKLAIRLNSLPLYEHFLKANTKPGDYISLQLSSKRPKRSTSQNNFFHLYLSLVGKASGHTIEELKAWVKGKILTAGITEVFGDKVRVVKSTTDLNISEFAEMMERIAELTDVPIPDPEPFNLPLTHDEYGKLKAKQEKDYEAMKVSKDSGLVDL
jgi:hypothetical protein